ncbi:MAG: hypothetical protein ACR2L4_02745 [Actinomycetota bacterium]
MKAVRRALGLIGWALLALIVVETLWAFRILPWMIWSAVTQ